MLDSLIRKLPDFKGKHRLVKMLYGKKLRTSEDILVKGKFGCEYLLPNLEENVGLEIFINGVYEESIVNFLRKIIPQKGHFLDLGANIGAISIPVCKLRPDISTIGVEAAPWIYSYLQKNLQRNNITNARIMNNALFNKDNLLLDFFTPRDKYGKGSLAPVFSQDPVKVIAKKVDTIVRELNFGKVNTIKIDVEGFEYFVFQGAEQLLTQDESPDIIFEFVDWAESAAMNLSPGSAQLFLKEHGYRLYNLEKNKPQKMDNILISGAANLFASKKDL